MDEIDQKAIRHVALLAWDGRDKLGLTSADIEQLLIAWMAVGTLEEAEAASALLAAQRAAASQQTNFDRLLHRESNA